MHCKPGVVYLWPVFPLATNASLRWSNPRSLPLQTQKVSFGSSYLYPVSGVMYIHSEDALVLCLFDGSLHVINGLSTNPSYPTLSSASQLVGDKLSATCRSIFSQAEMGRIRSTDVNRTSGMMSYDGSSTVVWIHEYVHLIWFFHLHCYQRNTGHVDQQISVISTKQNTTACLLSRSYGTKPTMLPLQMISQLYYWAPEAVSDITIVFIITDTLCSIGQRANPSTSSHFFPSQAVRKI